jgi:DMSO/TMAO reductase YedYZ molybdopterin-dependent catalytic subunit
LVTESPPTSINLERAAHKKLHTLAQRISCFKNWSFLFFFFF